MDVVDTVAPSLLGLLHRDIFWMSWNTVLAWIPVVLALLVFRTGRDGQTLSRSPLRWAGAVLFVLFLPNAPYVVTDLVHLRWDIRVVGDGPVVSTVLPLYAVLIASGFLAYHLALAELGRYLDATGRSPWKIPAILTCHLLCAVGIFLGRWARLNSWEPVVQPRGAIDRILLALTWEHTALAIAVLFVTTAVGHFMTKAIAEATVATTRRATLWLRPSPSGPA
ncbi:DUF1361 domain-containing protein [Nocardia terpenica]|uniref:DUF1361 domain-containing protein n=1 Tax=Nocardia terpenica TaxID=455432 RepID=UPI00082A5EE8|nr:DUF1361 domain-containing protein [Nocardia terpenica]MBF6065137.1 DUF1361 domain-containing protein [Nocardia terpenica]MBF6108194.1 DUF1361 domain-containing protein [Nocardia terpenica]MBF6115409.1 DUF1361 domain-containing protein [Nocardia terpenica]MBF6122731.1 DUF1361 domain-containing protein [Nocardia terpenica]MBF6157235.1 DUF1361 domain-containing protein [Nocardia terpenica]